MSKTAQKRLSWPRRRREDGTPIVGYTCDNCGAEFGAAEATRTETMGGLDPDAWQTLCCPACSVRVKTVFVGRD